MKKAVVRRASIPRNEDGTFSIECDEGETLFSLEIGMSGVAMGTFVKYVNLEPPKVPVFPKKAVKKND